MFSSLKVKNFRLYWFGMFVSLIGTWIQNVVQSWLIFHLTNSVLLLGLVGFLGAMPIFFLSFIGGVIADKVDNRKILLFTQSAFMVLALALAVLTQLKLVTPEQIMLISVLNGVVMAFDASARQAVVVRLAGKEHLLNAIALNSAAFNSARIIGPAVASILILSVGMFGCFYVNAISFIAVIIALLLIKNNELPKTNNKRTDMLKDLAEGLKFIINNRIVLVLMILVGVNSLFGIPYAIFMPVFANDVLKVGVKGLGMLMSSSGVGALLAALVLARLGNFKQRGKLMIISFIVFSIALIVFSLSKIYVLSLVIMVVLGWTTVMAISLVNNSLQILVPDELRGRVMSAFLFTFVGIAPFGSLIEGVMSQAWGVSFAVTLSGSICLVFFLAVGVFFPKIRRV